MFTNLINRYAWHKEKGLSKWEAKRQYVSALIENMHKYATETPEAQELIKELEQLWDYYNLESLGRLSNKHSRDFSIASSQGPAPPLISAGQESNNSLSMRSSVQVPSINDDPDTVRRWRLKVDTMLTNMRSDMRVLHRELARISSSAGLPPASDPFGRPPSSWVQHLIVLCRQIFVKFGRHLIFEGIILLIAWLVWRRKSAAAATV